MPARAHDTHQAIATEWLQRAIVGMREMHQHEYVRRHVADRLFSALGQRPAQWFVVQLTTDCRGSRSTCRTSNCPDRSRPRCDDCAMELTEMTQSPSVGTSCISAISCDSTMMPRECEIKELGLKRAERRADNTVMRTALSAILYLSPFDVNSTSLTTPLSLKAITSCLL